MNMYGTMPGEIFRGPDGKIYKCVAYCEHPTVTLEQIDPAPIDDDEPSQIGGAIHALMWEGFEKLVPEKTG